MRELVVGTLDTLEYPAISLQLPDHLRAPHGGYYNHLPEPTTDAREIACLHLLRYYPTPAVALSLSLYTGR